MISKVLKTVTFAGLSFMALSSYAATITLAGPNITYQYDDTQAAIGLFGTPTIIGDGVRFLPPAFRAESTDGTASALTTANFVFSNVYSNNGADIMSISVVEFGDYEITNGDSVEADLLLTVFNNDNISEFASDSASFDASGGSAGLQTWDMSVIVDPSQDAIFTNTVSVSIQNTLKAYTDAFGETAWIQKKLSFIASEDTGVLPPVPVPAAAWLFGSALLGLLGVARRKRS